MNITITQKSKGWRLWLQRLVRHPNPIQTRNVSPNDSEHSAATMNRRRISNPEADAYVEKESQPLLQLLAGLECPTVRKVKLPWLAQTRRERRAILKIASLWRSLGRPRSGFWMATRIFYNRMGDSYNSQELMSNAADQRPRPGASANQ